MTPAAATANLFREVLLPFTFRLWHRMQTLSCLAISAVLAAAFAISIPAPVIADDSAMALFEKRVLPILNSAKPSSCAECHLSGVDLKDYIRKDQKQTFASLVAAGLVDTQRPDDSKILAFISRE